MQSLLELGLLEAEAMPIFDEATQTAAHFLEMPICTFGLLDRDRIWLKAAVGLSRIGLMNQLAASRQLPRTEELFLQVIERQRPLAVLDAAEDDRFSRSVLVQQYGIRAYLGVPVVDSRGHCLGVMAVMDLAPRQFDDRNVQFLELMARWSISEFERNLLLSQPAYPSVSEFKQTSAPLPNAPILSPVAGGDFSNHFSNISNKGETNQGENPALIKAELISEMAQELSTPLTSILGMARVLSQGIYGNLTDKQQEYIEIIHNSGQYLLSLVNEIVELGSLDDRSTALNLSPVDVEMLCQLTIGSLNQTAQRREQEIQLTVEPGLRLWMLDKDKVRQILYHLVFNVIQSSSPNSVIRIHGSRRNNALHIVVWTSHPWLGDGLPMSDHTPLSYAATATHSFSDETASAALNGTGFALSQSTFEAGSRDNSLAQARSRENLSLMLSHLLAALHQGCITVQGSHEEGFRYVIRLPQLQELAPNN
ncbi:GAF domain-containing sensor histidine kinase [Leptolyngbya ohadii]|uniref:GAF domain-containing sensor histidine kinase n=1 Tax=Leptolyngbya ohadii TaxID=1962290 RepID=UPI0015C5AFBB|nr:GAF domain-containing sensor histidine kinase [Leptolyngbya ohadii]